MQIIVLFHLNDRIASTVADGQLVINLDLQFMLGEPLGVDDGFGKLGLVITMLWCSKCMLPLLLMTWLRRRRRRRDVSKLHSW